VSREALFDLKQVGVSLSTDFSRKLDELVLDGAGETTMPESALVGTSCDIVADTQPSLINCIPLRSSKTLRGSSRGSKRLLMTGD
jgi:hypothetical protein